MQSNTKLECPHCHYTLTIAEWNESVKDAVAIGRAEELIPEDLEGEDWRKYTDKNGGSTDCPKCGQVCVFDDMEAF